jgi:hypothetical protein
LWAGGGRGKREGKRDGPRKKMKKEGEKKVGRVGLMGWRPGVVGREKKRGPILGGKREKERERFEGIFQTFEVLF